MTPGIGVKVDVGGCVGVIERIVGKTVTVKGTYYYPDGDKKAYAEPWTSFFHIDKFTPETWNNEHMMFDLSGVETSFL